MDDTHVSFTKPILGPDQNTKPTSATLLATLATSHGVKATCRPSTAGPPSTVYFLSGDRQKVAAARGSIVRSSPREYRRSIPAARASILESPYSDNCTLLPDVLSCILELARNLRVDITVFDSSRNGTDGPVLATTRSATTETVIPTSSSVDPFGESWREEAECRIVICGAMDKVETASTSLLVYIDKLSGLQSVSYTVNHKIQQLLSGTALQAIQEQTGTNIYLSTPLAGIWNEPPNGHRQGSGYRQFALPATPPRSEFRPPANLQPLQPNVTGTSMMTNHSHFTNFPHPANHFDPLPPPGWQGPWHPPHAFERMARHYSPRPLYGSSHGSSSAPNQHGLPGPFQPSRIGSPVPGQPHIPMFSGPPGPQYSIVGPRPFMPLQQPQQPMRPRPRPAGVAPPHLPVDRFPGSHPGLSDYNGEEGQDADQVHITGEPFHISKAIARILELAGRKRDSVMSRDIDIHPRKLEWILTERLDDLRQIMRSNGTYIQTPSIGTGLSLLTVFGDDRTAIHRSVRSVMSLTAEICQATIFLLADRPGAIIAPFSLSVSQIQPLLELISSATGVEVSYEPNRFEIYGLEDQVRAACHIVLIHEALKNITAKIRYQVEASIDHREFISGKKMGKFNKIIKAHDVEIKTEALNEHNFLIELSGIGQAAISGLSALVCELPAELSFFIPQQYHKGIIGQGGGHIQTIMQKHEVYIHCANAEELRARGGYRNKEDNTYIQTPVKNQEKLELAKDALMALVQPADRHFIRETVAIPRRHHRLLLSEKGVFLRGVGRDINQGPIRLHAGGELVVNRCTVRFPAKETGSDLITIFGPQMMIEGTRAILLSHVPYEAELRVPYSIEKARQVMSDQFKAFIGQLALDFRIFVQPSTEVDGKICFMFRCNMANKHSLQTARDRLVQWLEHGKNKTSLYDNLAASTYTEDQVVGLEDSDMAPLPLTSDQPNNIQALFERTDASALPGHDLGEGHGFAGPLAVPHTQDRIRSVTHDRAVPLSHSNRGHASRTLSYDVAASRQISRAFLSGTPLIAPGPSRQRASPQFHHGSTVGGRFSMDSMTQVLNDTST